MLQARSFCRPGNPRFSMLRFSLDFWTAGVYFFENRSAAMFMSMIENRVASTSPAPVMSRTLSTWRKLFIQTILRFDRDDGMFLASGLAFNVILCLLPFLLILASLWGYFLESSQQAQQDVLAFVTQAL